MSYRSVVNGLSPVHFVFDNLVDEAAGGNDLTAAGGATRQTTDTPGAGIPDYWDFDGVDGYLWAADDPAFDITGNLTVVWWVRRSDAAQEGFADYWAKGDANAYQARLGASPDIDGIRFDLRNGSNNTAEDVDSLLAADTWYLRVCRYDQSVMEVLNVSNTDGAVTVGASTARGTAIGTNALHYTVAAQNDTGSNIRRFWDGHMVPPILFNTALSDADITSIWDAKDAAADDKLQPARLIQPQSVRTHRHQQVFA